jgi:hypothetical protein
MRRTHWWGTTAVAGVLLSAVVAAPAAMAAPDGRGSRPQPAHKSSQAMHGSKHGDNRHGDNRHVQKAKKYTKKNAHHSNNRGQGHAYPANGSLSVSLDGPSRVRAGSTVRLTVKVSINKATRRGLPVALWASKDNRHWKKVAVSSVGKNGTVVFKFKAKQSMLLRAVAAGSRGMAPGQSDIFKLKVKNSRR